MLNGLMPLGAVGGSINLVTKSRCRMGRAVHRWLHSDRRAIHTGAAYVDAANTQLLPSWTRFDIGARYTFLSPWNGKPIVIRAAVENVENLGYYASGYSGVVGLGAPRTYLVSTTFNF
ncbi:TonB-dependent receptor-like protein [Rhodopseudomonas thermotolerans]|uniref:TonB-dependent receptor-like protein n=2 Tax=Rhodopseudomonas TaxID=1073 RepID=A0A336JSS7_9BRAD|nr:TonB-dependent receptor-like protein [Rhodopseudomonas pentothenatexigens]REG08300.1 TonB-dependent receptor-like protein [Rhodopseudomonas thermotolerans]SSW89111.1 TonB-dependent receptor-like protein [Rhodopseudomonas pentothenatexigens]